jgi:Na+/H+ antiporter NhaD/arsenite permease-like protein
MEPLTLKIFAIALFVITYIFIIAFYHKKTIVTGIAIAVLLAFGILTPFQAAKAVNWNVILLYVGMLFISEVFLFSKVPDYLAVKFVSKSRSVAFALLAVCAFTGILSIFLENVACVLIVAPIALAIARELKVNPVPMFIGMAISSNLQGSATLIGDPPSMLLGSYAKLSFNDFFILDGKPGIFFAVEIGALVSLAVLYFYFKNYKSPCPKLEPVQIISWIPSMLMALLIVSLIVAGFFDIGSNLAAGIICCIFGVISLLWFLEQKKEKLSGFMGRLDWSTGIFLILIFVLVESLNITGVISDIANLIIGISGQSLFASFMIIVWMSVLLSAFIDNVPYLVAMLPVTALIMQHLGTTSPVLYMGLLIGASVGGNVTPIGASANVVAMGILKNKGYETSFKGFVKMGLPFTIATVLASTMFVWMIWG